MQHNAAFHQCLHSLLRLKQPSGTEKYHYLETSTCDPFKYKLNNSILIVSVCMGNSIGIQRLKYTYDVLLGFFSMRSLEGNFLSGPGSSFCGVGAGVEVLGPDRGNVALLELKSWKLLLMVGVIWLF